MSEVSNVAIVTLDSPPMVGSLGFDPDNYTIGGRSSDIGARVKAHAKEGIYSTIFTSNQVETDVPIIEEIDSYTRVVQLPVERESTHDRRRLWGLEDRFTELLLEFTEGERPYELVQSEYWMSHRSGAALARRDHAPDVVKFHTEEAVKALFVPEAVLDVERRQEEGRIARTADAFMVSTESCIPDLESIGVDSNKIYVVPSGYDPEIFKPHDKRAARLELGISQDKYVVIGVGRPDPFKNYEMLLGSIRDLHIDDVMLYLVGGSNQNPEKQRLATLSRTLGIEDKVRFIEQVTQESLPDWYSAADVQIVTSWHETFCRVILEGMACGLPVVATSVGAIPYLVRDGSGVLTESDNSIQLARHLNRLYVNENRRREIGENAKRHAQQYTIERIAPILKETYNNITTNFRMAA